MSDHVRQTEPFRWEGIAVKPYKSEGSHFAGITRQTLFEGGDGLACQLRYFEIAPGGWSSLERHHHAHAVMIVRGAARVLAGDRLIEARTHDLVRIPPLTWHQFQTSGGRAARLPLHGGLRPRRPRAAGCGRAGVAPARPGDRELHQGLNALVGRDHAGGCTPRCRSCRPSRPRAPGCGGSTRAG